MLFGLEAILVGQQLKQQSSLKGSQPLSATRLQTFPQRLVCAGSRGAAHPVTVFRDGRWLVNVLSSDALVPGDVISVSRISPPQPPAVSIDAQLTVVVHTACSSVLQPPMLAFGRPGAPPGARPALQPLVVATSTAPGTDFR
jgi:hypothetical protein